MVMHTWSACVPIEICHVRTVLAGWKMKSQTASHAQVESCGALRMQEDSCQLNRALMHDLHA